MDVKGLHALATEIIALRSGDPDVIILKLGQYATAFEEWYAAYQRGEEKLPQVLGEELAGLHQQVLQVAEEQKQVTSVEMQKLREKGKGVLRYIDTLPRRVSFTRTKRG